MPHSAAYSAMQVHLGAQGGVGDLGEAGHPLQSRRPGAGQGQQASVVDQEQVVLTHIEAKPVRIQGAVADPAHERVLLLGFPEIRGGPAELIAKAHRRAGVPGWAVDRRAGPN